MKLNTGNSPMEKIKRITVFGMLNIIYKKKIEEKDNLINKIWKHFSSVDMGFLLV